MDLWDDSVFWKEFLRLFHEEARGKALGFLERRLHTLPPWPWE